MLYLLAGGSTVSCRYRGHPARSNRVSCKDSGLRFVPFPEMGWQAPQAEVWVSDLANVGFLSLPEREEKIESHAVRSSKTGRWFPEIKNKARGKGAIGRQSPAAQGSTC